MAAVTNQRSSNSGADASVSDRTQTVQSESNRQTEIQTIEATQEEGAVETTEESGAATNQTTETSDPQVNTTKDDHAFTLTFTVPLEGSLPCNPIEL